MVYTNNRFEWDPEKAVRNVRKHGVPFFMATLAFYDPNAKIEGDPSHSTEIEIHERLIGMSLGELICVIYTDRKATGKLRIISARPANLKERKRYENRS